MTEIPAITVGDVDDLDAPVLLDVREADEFAAGHAPGAVHVPLGALADSLDRVDLDGTVLCICRSGVRSARATAFLRDQGVDAINLDGGMQAWAAFGLDLVADGGGAGQVI
jgi:rhodanese-related sulfurtransferase